MLVYSRVRRQLAVCVACGWTYGEHFFQQVFTGRQYLPLKATWMSVQWMLRMCPGGALLAVVLRRDAEAAPTTFAHIYVLSSVVVAVALAGGTGVNWNIFFDATWAMCLGAALALRQLLGRPRTSGWVAVAVAMWFVVAAVPLTVRLATARSERAALRESVAGIDFIRSHPGPAACERLALCFWAGKEPAVDFFNLQQAMRRNVALQNALVESVNATVFKVIQIERPGRDLGGAFNQALANHYRVAITTSEGVYFVPQ